MLIESAVVIYDENKQINKKSLKNLNISTYFF